MNQFVIDGRRRQSPNRSGERTVGIAALGGYALGRHGMLTTALVASADVTHERRRHVPQESQYEWTLTHSGA